MVNTPEHDTRAAWDRIAPGYDRTNTPTQMSLGNEGLRRVGLRAACGSWMWPPEAAR